jgi:hypothetical protein
MDDENEGKRLATAADHMLGVLRVDPVLPDVLEVPVVPAKNHD